MDLNHTAAGLGFTSRQALPPLVLLWMTTFEQAIAGTITRDDVRGLYLSYAFGDHGPAHSPESNSFQAQVSKLTTAWRAAQHPHADKLWAVWLEAVQLTHLYGGPVYATLQRVARAQIRASKPLAPKAILKLVTNE
jgi:hypothetical protein